MTIRIYCPACRTPFDVDDSLVGEKGLCPSCQSKFTIRKPDPPSTGQTHSLGGGLGGGASVPLPPESKPCGLPVTMAILVMAAYGGAMFWVFKAYPTGSVPPRQLDVLGITHPLLLHMPIGMLIGGLVLDFFGGRGRVYSAAVTGLLWLTLLSGFVTALAGYFLGLKGYSSEFFTRHLWTGIFVPVAAGLTLITKLIHDSKPAMTSAVYRFPLLGTASLIAIAGHYGGEMSHGFDVPGKIQSLFVSAPAPAAGPVEERTVYHAVIAPLLADKCVSCHGEQKQKGDLRLDSIEAIVKAGESGKISVVPGKSSDSETIRRILTDDEDDHMPPKNKNQLTADEIEILKWWVDAGAKTDLKIKDANLPAALKARVISMVTGGKSGAKTTASGSRRMNSTAPVMGTGVSALLGTLFILDGENTQVIAQTPAPAAPAPAPPAPAAPQPPAAAPPAAAAPAPAPPAPAAAPAPAPAPAAAPAPSPADEKIKALEKELGIVLLPVAQNDPSLTFNCVNVADKFGDTELAKFAPIADRFVELNLSRSKVTDAAAATLAGMKNLKRLNLANTAITDAAADQLTTLTGLEYINLVGTKVTDAAMPKFEKVAALKKLYVWQTGVTKPAAEALHKKLPAIAINLGWDNEVKTAQAPPPPPAATPAPAPASGPVDPEKPVYAGLIEPIFAAKCTACHGDKKQKGKLAMHTLELLMKGGDSGEKTVVAGKSGESLIIKRAALPADDDDHMPPKDKDQLTEKEVKILKWWIDSGLKNDVKIKDAGLPEELKK